MPPNHTIYGEPHPNLLEKLGCTYFSGDSHPCMGKGICVNFTLEALNNTAVEGCLCNEGWTGRGDFVDSSFLDCPTYEPLVFVTYILQTIAYFFLTLYSSRVLNQMVKRRRKKGKVFKVRKVQTVAMIVAFAGVKLIEAAARIASGQESLKFSGEDTVVTVLNFIGGLLFWALIAPHFFVTWMKLIHGMSKVKGDEQRKKRTALVSRVQKLAIPASIMGVISFSTVPLALAVSDLTSQLIVTRFYYFGCTLLSAYFINIVLVPAGAMIKKISGKVLRARTHQIRSTNPYLRSTIASRCSLVKLKLRASPTRFPLLSLRLFHGSSIRSPTSLALRGYLEELFRLRSDYTVSDTKRTGRKKALLLRVRLTSSSSSSSTSQGG